MKKILLLLMLALFGISCTHKDLHDEDPCDDGDKLGVRVVMNWDDPAAQARVMRYSLFARTSGVEDYDRDAVPVSGVKYISLPYGASYKTVAYDYYARNIYFREETNYDNIEAYCAVTSRATYDAYIATTVGEGTVSEPGDFYVDVPAAQFDVIPVSGQDPLELNFYPKNVVREFTFCIRDVQGAGNIAQARGAISGMAASYFITRKEKGSVRVTVLFDDATANAGDGTITGRFYTFGPVEPYTNYFTIEVISKSSVYLFATWDVSSEVVESMADRAAKLARDGYDILIDNDGELPEIPNGGTGGGSGSGFEIGVGDWEDVWVPVG